MFAIDPGETTGWAWACIGRSELQRLGMVGALEAARRHASGLQLNDTRFAQGQVPAVYSDGQFFEAEYGAAVDLWIDMKVRSNMTARTSGGVVPEITDLVYEDFTLRERTQTRDLLSPIRVTAMHQAIVLQKEGLGAPRMHLQSSSDKSVITDDQLKAWGLYLPGKPHSNDACRHLCLWLRKLEKDLGFSL